MSKLFTRTECGYILHFLGVFWVYPVISHNNDNECLDDALLELLDLRSPIAASAPVGLKAKWKLERHK